jgi:uncharacterized membrane protein
VAAKKHKGFIRLPKTEYQRGDTVPVSAIYECSECDNVTAYKKGEIFVICDNCHTQDDEQRWYRTNEIVHFVSKNLNTEFARIETVGLRAADVIAEFSGSITFVIIHIIWFWAWLHANLGGSLFGLKNFDPYPFGLLTMIVSLEAIILATFILISQNRQAQKSELRAELDYQVNLKTEKDVAEVLSVLKELRAEGQVMSRKTSEILADTSMITEEPAPKKGKRPVRKGGKRAKKSESHEIIKEAGIDIVTGND